MADPWSQTVAQALARGSLGTVLCLGRAGLELIMALPPGTAQQIVLLEPDPRQTARHRQNARDALTVLDAGFAASTGSAQLHCFSMRACDALRPASGLKMLLPGLHQTGTQTVKTLSAKSLMAQVALDSTRPNLLFLGAPGEEMTALDAFHAAGALSRFHHIITPLPRAPLYTGAADGEALQNQLHAAGYRLSHHDLSELDCPLAWFQKDTDWHALITERDRLRKQLAAQGNAMAAQDLADLQERYAGLKAHNATLEDLIAQLTVSLKAAATDLDNRPGGPEAADEAADGAADGGQSHDQG